MNKRDVNLLKRLVDIRLKMMELEEDVEKDIEKYWKLQYDKIQLKSRFGGDATEYMNFYDSLLEPMLTARQIKTKTLADMKKLYEEI